MDETAVRELLREIAADEAPPCTVDIALARRPGRSSGLRLRQSARSRRSWVAPVAAAAAVAAIAGLTLTVELGHRPAPAPRTHQARPGRPPMTVPRQFTALQPYVSFGWLPPGFTAAGLAGIDDSQPAGTSVSLQASAPHSDGRVLTLVVYARGQCSVIGADRVRIRDGGRARRLEPAATQAVTYPHGLSCAGPIRQAAAPIDGGPAYRGPEGTLYWEYGRDAWAALMPGMDPSLIHATAPAALRSWLNFPAAPPLPGQPARSAWRQSAASYQLLRRVAGRLRFNPAPARPLYGFALSGLPASWGAGYSTGLGTLTGRVASEGWQAGPAVDNSALSISVWPASRPQGNCNFVDGQSQYVTLDGTQVMLRTIDQPYKHWQELCSMNLAGLQVLIELDLNAPGTDNTPLPGGPEVSSVLAIFRHLRLLGPDVQNWTGLPLR
jgi:hypothetical protein